ncbi:MAG TPA: MBL fold metallo-hydrolase [Eubacteriaceae bacterium]|nr:MBL fold metallo-hydrolase [Eubacteriaceae bacterium]
MKITEQLYVIPIEIELSHGKATLYPTLVKDESNTVLIDTGFDTQESYEALEKGLHSLGFAFNDIDTIILTHQDLDHIGGLHHIIETGEKSVEVYFHEEELPYIDGKKPLIKGPKDKMPSLIDHIKKKLKHHNKEDSYLKEWKDVKVIRLLRDGDLLPLADGIQVIHMPGHTPGNICLYHPISNTLIAGDSLNCEDQSLYGPNPVFTPEMDQAYMSLKKLLKFDIQRVICYHGGIFEGEGKSCIEKIIQDYENKKENQSE